jgi:hypothetical protein
MLSGFEERRIADDRRRVGLEDEYDCVGEDSLIGDRNDGG